MNYLANARRNRMWGNPVSVGDYYIAPANAKVYLPVATPAPGTAAFAASNVVAPTPVFNAVNPVQSNGPAIGSTIAGAAMLFLLKPGELTIAIGTPAIFTFPGHGLAEEQLVQITTTGELPTGLSVYTQYYVTQPTANTFKLIFNTALIVASGTQSGVHSLLYQSL